MARGAIAEALRSLAKALDQIEAEEAADRWEVVSREEAGVDKGACVEGKEQTASSGQDSGELATGSLVAYKIDIRHYVVLAQPEYPQDLGYWSGPAATTCRRIESKLRNQRLAGSRARLRRVDSKAQALDLWKQAHPGREMPIHLM